MIETSDSEDSESTKKSATALRKSGRFEDSIRKGQYWVQQAAESGYPAPQAFLGMCQIVELCTPGGAEEGLNWVRKAALGDASSQHQLASMYERGMGLIANSEDAYFWWYLSTIQNHIGGELNSEGYWSKLTATQIQVPQKKARMWKPITP